MTYSWRHPRRTIAVGLLAAGGILSALFPTGASATAGPAVAAASFPAYALFNVPADDGTRDRRIEDEIVALADGAPAGAYIRGAMFTWTSPVVPQALARAAARGVIVRLAIDREGAGGANQAADNAAVKAIRAGGLDDVTWCGTSSASVAGSSACIGNFSNSINHNKFFTFSTSGSRKRVVLVTSQNLTFSQNNLFNNAVVVSEDYDLYDHFVRYFNDLRAERKNNNYADDVDGYYKSPTTAVTVYHFPRANVDTVAHNALSFVTTFESGCVVEVVEASFTDPRTAVADQLLRIAQLGCKVRIVFSSMGAQVRAILTRSANVTLKKYDDREASNIDGREISVHSKYLVLTGNYNGSAGRSIVFTGSHNLTGPSLGNHDETLMKIEHPGVSASFRSNFATVWSRAKCVNPESGSCLL